MRIQGQFLGILTAIGPGLYVKRIIFENGKKTLYVQVLKSIYGILILVILFKKKFRGYLGRTGFEFNT